MATPEILTEVFEINYQNIAETWSKVPKFLRDKMAITPEYIASGFIFPADDETPKDETKSAPETAETIAEETEGVEYEIDENGVKKVKLPF